MRQALNTALAALLASAAAAVPALAQQQPYDDFYGRHMTWGWGIGWAIGPVMMLIFFGIIIFFVVLLVRWLWPGHPQQTPPRSQNRALEILEERFARGEIERQEYEEKRSVLER